MFEILNQVVNMYQLKLYTQHYETYGNVQQLEIMGMEAARLSSPFRHSKLRKLHIDFQCDSEHLKGVFIFNVTMGFYGFFNQ